MNCEICGDATNQCDGALRDLGAGLVPVCAACQPVADRITSTGSSAGSEEVTTKYAV